jgi:hypothetical protein
MDHVFNPRVDIPEKFADGLEILWVAGDDNAPTIWGGVPNVADVLTLTGVPTVGVSPYQLDGGGAVPLELYGGASRRQTVANVDPLAAEDIVVFGTASADTADAVFGTSSALAGRGYKIQRTGTENTIRARINGDTGLNLTIAGASTGVGSFFSYCIVVERGANSTLYVGGTTTSIAGATPAGVIGGAEGFSIGALIGGANALVGCVGIISIWYGVGIAAGWNTTLADELFAMTDGIRQRQGATLPAFTRGSSASWQNRNGVWFIPAIDMPRAGDATVAGQSGGRIAPLRENECYRNLTPANTNGIVWTGGVAPTVVDDSAALLAAGCQAFGPNVYQYANSTGAVQYIRSGAQSGDVNPRSQSVLARITAGAGVDIGLYDEVGATFAGAAITDGYATRTLDHGRVPAAATTTWCLRVQNGATVRFIAQQKEVGPRTTTIIPVYSTVAAETRLAETFTLPDTPLDAGGGIEFGITAMDWASGSLGVASRVIERSGGVTLLVSINAAGAVEATDGTTTVGTSTLDDGVRSFVRLTWGDGGLRLEVDGVVEDVAYDGVLPQTGTFVIESTVGEYAIDSFRWLRQQSGL